MYFVVSQTSKNKNNFEMQEKLLKKYRKDQQIRNTEHVLH